MSIITASAMTRHTFTGPITAKNAASGTGDSFQQLLGAAANAPTQKTAAASKPSQVKETEKPSTSDTVQAFKDYMKKTPMEQMEEAWLKRHGLTSEDLKAMPPEEQAAIRDQMAKELKEQMAEAAQKHEPVNILA